MAGRPEKNSARLRHALSVVYAKETRSGSREFQASSAARAFCAAVSRVKGGNGGRPCEDAFTSELLAELQADRTRLVHDGVPDAANGRVGTDVRGAFGISIQAGPLVEGILDGQL